jgi:dienelactone hydrolase
MPDLTGLPSSLLAHARFVTLGGVPALVATPPEASAARPAPWLLWMHGRTVTKELDPGRYLRLLRAGIASVAVDLPGHGERLEPERQAPEAALGVIEQMAAEIDAVVAATRSVPELDPDRVAIGGMSAGGMATLVRLCRPHRFVSAIGECTTGDLLGEPRFAETDPERASRIDPATHLERWREIPCLFLHNRHDEWVSCAAMERFVEKLRARAKDPANVRLHVYDRTGAPAEHAGFGRHAADAKSRVTAFLEETLLGMRGEQRSPA